MVVVVEWLDSLVLFVVPICFPPCYYRLSGYRMSFVPAAVGVVPTVAGVAVVA